MFTIKHITMSGIQDLYQSKVVGYMPAYPGTEGDSVTPATPETPPSLHFVDEDFGARSLFGGTIFVMNEQGATVSRYDLGASEVPLSADAHTAGQSAS